jgi:hypothetical protein
MRAINNADLFGLALGPLCAMMEQVTFAVLAL